MHAAARSAPPTPDLPDPDLPDPDLPNPGTPQPGTPQPDAHAFLRALERELAALQRDLLTVQDGVADLLDAGAPGVTDASAAPAVAGLQALDKATQVAGCLAAAMADWGRAWPGAPAAADLRSSVTLRGLADRLVGAPAPQRTPPPDRDPDPPGSETLWL